jgi:hypothetical protein
MGLQSDVVRLGEGPTGSGMGFKLNPVISRSCKQCWGSVWGYNVVGGWGRRCRVCWVVVAARVPRQSIDRPDSGASSGTLAW